MCCSCPESKPGPSCPKSSHYTDWAIPPIKEVDELKNSAFWRQIGWLLQWTAAFYPGGPNDGDVFSVREELNLYVVQAVCCRPYTAESRFRIPGQAVWDLWYYYYYYYYYYSQIRTAALRHIVRSWLYVPTFATRRLHACHHARVSSGGRWNCGREMSGNFA